MSQFADTYGFERADVGLHNWRERPYNAWAFQNVGELVECQTIAAGTASSAIDEAPSDDLLARDFGSGTIESFMARSSTESFLVSKAGQLVLEWHAGHTMPENPHIVFSVSKSITALIAGVLQDQGLFDPGQTVAHYMSEAIGSGYADCPLQHLLDMRVSLAFTEDYLDTTGDFARYRRATGWNPAEPGQAAEGLAKFLFSLAKGDEPHGGNFRYLSPNTDLLGLILERVSGKPYADLVSELLWQPLGTGTDAAIAMDGHGAPRAAGGICVTARDLLRLGHMILNGGTVGATRIISENWLTDTRNNGDPGAWADGDFAASMGPGRYRNKWYQLGPDSRQIVAVGIHGQWLFIDPRTEVVIVKLSSQALPLDEALDLQCLKLYGHISAMI
ncbi:MAG: beta-lactamase family protein [Hyphomicrobiales bacterium]|nr:beta-lactamase family protein [Hyphomicrobiales bacterium]